jgi:hypothetical protein
MATRSTIAMSVPEGIRAVYCHWDGYEEGVGQALKDYWTTPEALMNLLDHGDLSSLGASLSETVFYADRGENTPARLFKSEGEWFDWAVSCGCEYAYLLVGDAWKSEAI